MHPALLTHRDRFSIANGTIATLRGITLSTILPPSPRLPITNKPTLTSVFPDPPFKSSPSTLYATAPTPTTTILHPQSQILKDLPNRFIQNSHGFKEDHLIIDLHFSIPGRILVSDGLG